MVDDDVGAVAEHVGLDADRRDQPRLPRADTDVLHSGDRLTESARQVVVRGRELVGELVVATLEGGVALSDQHTLVGIADALYVDAKSEAVQQLRAELSLLGIHRAHEDEARRVRERHSFTLDDVHAHGRSVEQHIHQVVVE